MDDFTMSDPALWDLTLSTVEREELLLLRVEYGSEVAVAPMTAEQARELAAELLSRSNAIAPFEPIQSILDRTHLGERDRRVKTAKLV